jgi:hypothetical protein
MNSRGFAVPVTLAVCLSATLCFSAPETITKLSVPFSFPTTVGISGSRSFQTNNAAFLCDIRTNGKKIIELSWSLPSAAKNGTISIFSVSGSKIKTFSISSHEGKVEWDVTGSKKVGKGVYFASISYGPSKKNLKLIIN